MRTIADILGLAPDEYHDVYERLASARRVYRHVKRRSRRIPIPERPIKAYINLAAALDAVERDVYAV